ncbi:MAG: metallophosphoesterase [Mesorhizobium sp.]|uniref:metallophosphoesterase family protein n=1 Tax=unclassified Mesorhizobium TaxID=325217 RepID=UPI000F75A4A2|nr:MULTISPECIES: metallophosphoesterase [unclassified Mesorhizobium]AZO51292.1 metallophosphoesterase [Mesorhizobium sp. M4B.F.Ca.ET.058.02.1.1]RUX51017.1 metallophosphoesterase [Mesorhizobium sp. M4A.F.Ca.ET.050.02.1.1]RVC41785.1 metallophosphoesterase [Mesorhizobium sp. M4A.F.Ca.ET.090.04.2.1]RVD43240.1 metallophosphoesterase [Mesorhizobium sp. M4A.F.Ca.ET.020.02.1.1]RWC20118.1 MAG: metallophosphoesterase [Mesorhizobium sp.]
MFRLAHISDVHLGPLPGVTYRELASKRVVGYVNWQRNRRRHMHDAVIDSIVADLKASQPDHLAVTGDLVNLALDGEIEMARHWLETLGSPDDVSVVPGNHDAYVPGAFDKVCRSWAAWMTGDGVSGPVDRNAFPYLRVRGNVALIGVSTARATAPFMANGFFRAAQARRLGKILDATAGSGLFRVIMIHHPPVRGAVSQYKRLFGIELFQRTANRHGAELVLHGHSHDPTLFFIGRRGQKIPVVGVAAAGQGLGGRHQAAQYNLIDIDGERGDWQVRLTRRGLTGPAMPPSDLQVLELVADAEAPRQLVRS